MKRSRSRPGIALDGMVGDAAMTDVTVARSILTTHASAFGLPFVTVVRSVGVLDENQDRILDRGL